MKNFIENPIQNEFWDPSKGDYINHNVLKEDKEYINRKKRNKVLISFLAILHIVLLVFIFSVY